MRLDPIDPALAARIVARDERSGDDWHPQYPFEDELVPLRSLAAREKADPVFTLYAIRDGEGIAVGGFGFFGPPDESGTVEFGYGLIPAARGRGLATAAVTEGLRIAADHGAVRAIADTEETNLASLAVLARSGMSEIRREGGMVYVARAL
ncbi:GNAT family N-acetyltransferase [Microbacterium sp. Au-Mic1]|uniref:GNAT family N-acetyltransferase n=1 Tax=Microbacterium sp. Au-Mic1 TaxID=2906457 RepID=UPI001E2D5ABE|nr:GNAT family N-acetyltransferase [Microbacterium sp. Au-Mic1]MCE4025953.1 GNAT family N-acetyltransferase [Microbacterium sp. Au-Mic1]